MPERDHILIGCIKQTLGENKRQEEQKKQKEKEETLEEE